MFSLPRDTVDVPIPPGPARSAFGLGLHRQDQRLWTSVRNRTDLFPGNRTTCAGYNGLKAILGNLYGLDIKYFVEVNFDGFKKVVDAMGGVTINVQVPVSDDRFPSLDGSLRRVYIPSGIQHMDGAEALRYARSRHGSNDFDRGRASSASCSRCASRPTRRTSSRACPTSSRRSKSTVKTDIPVDQLAPLLGLASEVDTKNIRSYVFTPPFYQKEYPSSPRGYIIVPNVSKIRAAVKNAFTTDPADEAQRQKLAQEASRRLGPQRDRATPAAGRAIAGYLDYHGLAASAPRQKPPGAVPANTKIVAYNGAETEHAGHDRLPREDVRGDGRPTKTDPAIRTDIIVTVGQLDAAPRSAGRP